MKIYFIGKVKIRYGLGLIVWKDQNKEGLETYFTEHKKIRYGCEFISLEMLKNFTVEDLFYSNCWNTLQLRIYSIRNAETQYGYELIPMKKAKIKHKLGFILLNRLKKCMAGDNLVLSASFRHKRKCLKDCPHNLKKYEINGTSISTVYQLFIANYGLLLSLFIANWKRLRCSASTTLKNPKISW